jgi:excisionase family DNA binding protein
MAIVMTLDEVAQFLKIHPSTVYRLLKQHSIPAFKLGSDWRFNQESIER